MEGSKRCYKCGETKPVSEFSKSRNKPDGIHSECKECMRKYRMIRPFYNILKSAEKRAKVRDIPFSLTEEYLESIWTGVCPVFQTRLNLPSHGGHAYSHAKPSLDRLVPDRGYVPGNVIWISFKANSIKSDATSEEVQAVATWLQQTEEEIKRHEDTD